MVDPLSFGLAKDWIQRLLKLWSQLRRDRRAEIEKIENDFGDLEPLAPFYVEPDCQSSNPADHHEDEPFRAVRQPIGEWLNQFLKAPFLKRDGRHTVFLLSDAGMGKSSLLMMLKLTDLVRFWPSDLHFVLLKLRPDSLTEIKKLKRRSQTVLLLDALDEDPSAWGFIKERLSALLRDTESFRQVIITCRTQYFPKVGEAPIEKPGRIKVEGYVTNLLYLSPFSDTQVDAYLNKVYPNRILDKFRKLVTDADNPQLERARRLMSSMESLKMRPMLLSYIRDLMEADVERWTSYQIYQALVSNWLLREQRKLKGRITDEQLLQACRAVAIKLQATGARELELADLRRPLVSQEVRHLKEIEVGGRSLLNRTSKGSFRFAHHSFREFLVADALTERCISWTEGDKRLRMTGQTMPFLYSWIEEDPASRIAQVPWHLLEAGDSQPELRGLDLQSADLAGANLRGAILTRANLRDASLRRADLRGSDLRGADLRGADLRGVELDGTRVLGAKLEEALVHHAPGVEVRCCESVKEPKTNTRFRWIPGGSFQMGDSKNPVERPPLKAQISFFWLAETPVTRWQYDIFLKKTGYREPAGWNESRFADPEQPVVGVSWHDATAYCRWLREISRLPVTLPTEAQWEFAARGPETREYPWGSAPPDSSRACYGRDWRKDGPAIVGSFLRGRAQFGNYDLAGNVWEWCLDAWEEAADAKELERGDSADPTSDVKQDSLMLLRGGGWSNSEEGLRAALRLWFPAGCRDVCIGFRVSTAPVGISFFDYIE